MDKDGCKNLYSYRLFAIICLLLIPFHKAFPSINKTNIQSSRENSSLREPIRSYLLGNAEDAKVELTKDAGALLFMGGGYDVDEAFFKRVKQHLGPGIDIVVLRTRGEDGYNQYLLDLLEANSVETLIIDSRQKANSDELRRALQKAEFIWLAGGNQSQYHRYWTGTQIQQNMQKLYERGGVIGGTSAGMSTLSPISYNPDGVLGAITEEVLVDFCHPSIKFSENFFKPKIPVYLTDTHFTERNRMGRLVTFLGHYANLFPIGIAADEESSLFITSDGEAVSDGRGSVYILETSKSDFSLSQCQGPTIALNVDKIRLRSGDRYNFYSKATTGSRTTINVNGAMSTPYQPTNPYD